MIPLLAIILTILVQKDVLASPTTSPTTSPTVSPTVSPTTSPTLSPTTSPTSSPIIKGELTCVDFEECAGQTLNYESITINGYFSAKDATINAEEVTCNGAYSNNYSTVSARKTLHANGFRNFYYAKVQLAPKNIFNGFQSAIYAKMTTNGVKKVNVEFNGYYSAYQTEITCATGSTCSIVCRNCFYLKIFSEPGANVKLDCYESVFSKGCYEVQVDHQGDSLTLIGGGNGQVTVAPLTARRFSDSTKIDDEALDIPQELTTEQTDAYLATLKEPQFNHENRLRVLNSGTTCGDERECANTDITTTYAYCFGSEGCHAADISSTYTYCYGHYGCSDSTLRTRYVYAYGNYALADAKATGYYHYVYGYRAAFNAYFEPKKNIGYIYAYGYESLKNAYIKCLPGITCAVYCVQNSCAGSTLDCSQADENKCVSNCDESDENCPVVYERCASFSADNGNLAKCNSQPGCFKDDGVCHVKSNDFCSPYLTKADCKKKKKFCKWDNDVCIFKKLKDRW